MEQIEYVLKILAYIIFTILIYISAKKKYGKKIFQRNYTYNNGKIIREYNETPVHFSKICIIFYL